MTLDYSTNTKATVTTYNKEGQHIRNVLSIVENNYTSNDLNKIDVTLTVKNTVKQSSQVNFNKLGDIISADMPTGQTFTATVTEREAPNYFVVDDQQKAAPTNSSYISALQRDTKNDTIDPINVSYGRVGQNNFGGNTVYCSSEVYEWLLANRQQDWLMACRFSLPQRLDGYRYVLI